MPHSDFGPAFASAQNHGKQSYGNTMTHFSSDGRLITNSDEMSIPDRNPNYNRDLPDLPDFRSYDPRRDRTRRNNERNRQAFENRHDRDFSPRDRDFSPRDRDFSPRDRDYQSHDRNFSANERDYQSHERDYPPQDFYSPPGDHGAGYSRRQYDGGKGIPTRTNTETPIYGHTLPLPIPRVREHTAGMPTRRFDDYQSRDMRPKYEKSQYVNNAERFNSRFHHDKEPNAYDWRVPFSNNRYDQTHLVASRNHGGRYGVLATKKDAVFRQRPMAWFFLIAGLLLLGIGIVNLVICLPNYYYCFLWMGPLSIVLGIVGIVHGGRYKKNCQNLYYIANGVVVAIAAIVASGIVFLEYIPMVKELSDVDNQTEYYQLIEDRTNQPLVKTVATSTRVWVCVVFDSAGLVFVIADYMALYAVIIVAHKYWNNKHHASKSVTPFCKPALFNPFLQLIWGQLLTLMGVVSVFGCYGNPWHTYWTACAAGIVVILTGAVSSWAAKIPSKTYAGGLAILMNFLGITVSVGCIAINLLGFKENIEALQAGTDAHMNWLYGSAIIFGLVLALALVCFFYSMALLVRFSYYLTRSGYDRDSFATSSRSDQTVSTVRRYGYDRDRGFDDSSDPPLPVRSPQRTGFFGRWR